MTGFTRRADLMPDDTTEGLREVLTKALAPSGWLREDGLPATVDAVVGALSGLLDPGDEPWPRMAAEMRRHYILTGPVTVCACGNWAHGEAGPEWADHLAQVALSVRWDAVQQAAELERLRAEVAGLHEELGQRSAALPEAIEGLRERLKTVIESTDCPHEYHDLDACSACRVDAIVAEVFPLLERASLRIAEEEAEALHQRRRADDAEAEVKRHKAEIDRLADFGLESRERHQAEETHLERRIAAQQATIGAQSDKIEWLRAELAEAKAERDELDDTLDATMRNFEDYVEDHRPVAQERDALRTAGKVVIEQRDKAEAERDALKAAIKRVRALTTTRIGGFRLVPATEILAALDAPGTPERSKSWAERLADASLAAAREKFGPAFAPETPGDADV